MPYNTGTMSARRRSPPGPRPLVVISLDGLAAVDLPALRELPAFARLLDGGAAVHALRGIYPTQTYPLHATIATGVSPSRHGIHANNRADPGNPSPEWFWYRRDLQATPLFERATRRGIPTACLLWPVAGRARVRYLIPEITVVRPGQSQMLRVLCAGSPLFILRMRRAYGHLLRGIQRRYLDDFTTAVACDLIGRRRLGLLMLHLLDLDYTRHLYGFRSPEASRVLEKQDGRLARILAALEGAGGSRQGAVVVLGDHAYLDVHSRINLNTALREAGLLQEGPRGRVREWRAWAASCEGSAQLFLRDPESRTDRRRLTDLLRRLAADPESGVEALYEEEALREMGVGRAVQMMVEARQGYYFGAELRPRLVEPAEVGHRAAHGYHPDRPGYRSLALGAGRGLARGASLAEARILDLGPTLAALLGFALPGAEGRILEEILEPELLPGYGGEIERRGGRE